MILTLLESSRQASVMGGRVVVPGGALKGALRAALVAVLRGGSDQAEPRTCSGPTASGCGWLHHGPGADRACVVCRLFGAPGQEPAVWLGDGNTMADGVSFDTGRASPGLLSSHLGGTDSQHHGGWVALAPWGWSRSPDPELSKMLGASVRAVTAMGSLSGLDVEELRLETDRSAPVAACVPSASEPVGSGRVLYQLEVTLQTPMRLGERWGSQGPRIGGGILRSACSAVVGRPGNGSLDGDLYFGEAAPRGLHTVAPASQLVCSVKSRSHATQDWLLANAIGLGSDLRCGECGAPLILASDLGASMTRWSGLPWSATRTRGGAKVRQSAVAVTIPAGARWYGSVTALTRRAAEQCERLDGLDVSLGSGRSRGLGRARLAIGTRPLPSRSQRMTSVLDWDRRLASAAAAMALAGGGLGVEPQADGRPGSRLSAHEMALPLVARSPLLLSGPSHGIELEADVGMLLGEELCRLLEARVAAAVVKPARLGGYHRSRGLPRDARRVMSAGSTILLAMRRDRVTSGDSVAEALADRLEQLECEGVGLGRAEGLGRLELLGR